MKHLVLAAAALAISATSIGPADAAKRKVAVPNKFDGNWSIEVTTLDGPCERASRYGVQIYRGEALYPGAEVQIRGRVSANGTVNGSIARGNDSAQVSGRLAASGTGGGVWGTAPGSPIGCSGRWTATRRG